MVSLKTLHAKVQAVADRIDSITGGNPWQTPSPAGGWALGSSDGTAFPLRYRIENGSTVHLFGVVHTTNGTPGISVTAALPPGYRPSSNARFQVGEIGGTDGLPYAQTGAVSTGGVVQVAAAPSQVGTDVSFDARYRIS